MKKSKFILPILAFVMAITLAFAIPSEVESKSEVFNFAPAATRGPAFDCVSCPGLGLADFDDCAIRDLGTVCKCAENSSLDAYSDESDPDCELLRRQN